MMGQFASSCGPLIVGFVIGIFLSAFLRTPVSPPVDRIGFEEAASALNTSDAGGVTPSLAVNESPGDIIESNLPHETSQDKTSDQEGARPISVPNKPTSVPTYNCRKRFQENGTPPHFMVVGVHKGGSTALYNYLIKHGQVVPAVCKEIHFFDDDKKFGRGEKFYLKHFPDLSEWNGLAVTGEGSPDYIRDPAVASRIKAMYPTTKFLLVLREPTIRFRSHWLEKTESSGKIGGIGRLSCEEAWKVTYDEIKDCLVSTEKCFLENHENAIMQGLYFPQLVAWLNHFPPEQTMIIQSENLFENVIGTMQQVASFLGLRSFSGAELAHFATANTGTDHHDNPILAQCDSTVQNMQKFYGPYNKQLIELLQRVYPSVAEKWVKGNWTGI